MVKEMATVTAIAKKQKKNFEPEMGGIRDKNRGDITFQWIINIISIIILR